MTERAKRVPWCYGSALETVDTPRWRLPGFLTTVSHLEIGGGKRISRHLSRFSTFARHSDRDARNRSQLCYCFAAALKGAMPFAPAQAGSYDLTLTLVAMDSTTTGAASR